MSENFSQTSSKQEKLSFFSRQRLVQALVGKICDGVGKGFFVIVCFFFSLNNAPHYRGKLFECVCRVFFLGEKIFQDNAGRKIQRESFASVECGCENV